MPGFGSAGITTDIEVNTEHLWPRTVSFCDLNIETNSIIEDLYHLQSTEKSIERSNRLGWHSRDDLHLRNQYKQLVDIIVKCTSQVLQRPTIVNNMWAIITPKYGYNTCHTHPDCDYSGAFYLRMPEGSGGLRFIDLSNTETGQRYIDFNTPEKRLLFFENNLAHEVTQSFSDQDRIVISFNVDFLDGRYQHRYNNGSEK